jgi:hypothetical protein
MNHVGTAAPGCPVERSSTVFAGSRISGASLREDSGGRLSPRGLVCPHEAGGW